MNLPIPNLMIDLGALLILVTVIIGILYRINGNALHHFFYWKIFHNDVKKGNTPISKSVSSFFVVLAREVFIFRVLGTCNRGKRVSHLAIFWGFVSLAISTTLAYLTNPTNVILPLYNPVKLFGNGGGILVLIGFIGMLYVRSREGDPIWRFTRSDVFLLTLFLSVVTGFITQQAVYSSLDDIWVSSSFWLHMVFVVILLATAPFTKFFHAVSKPVSLLHEEIDNKIGVEPLLPKNTSYAENHEKLES